MRGDSLRDLYAKTLALVGLALLAGAGAIVDYWPVGGTIPRVSAAKLPVPNLAVLEQRLDIRIPPPASAHPVIIRGTIRPKNVGTARFLIPAVTATTAVPKPDVPAAPAQTSADPEASTLAAVPEPLPVEPSEVAWFIEVPQPMLAPSSGIFTGALRKTRDSILKTGAAANAAVAVTGSTLADAFKGVFGAFRKVTPF